MNALLYARDLKDGIADVRVIDDGDKILILFTALSSSIADTMLKSGVASGMAEDVLKNAVENGMRAAIGINKRR